MRVAKFARALALIAPILALGACKGDITDEGAGDPFAIVLSASGMATTVDGAVTVNGTLIDRYRTPLPVTQNVTSSNPGVVRVDSVRYNAELQITVAFLKGVAKSAEGAKIVFSNGSLSDTTTVIVN